VLEVLSFGLVISGLFFILEIFIGLAKKSGSIYSGWMLMALLYMLSTIWAEIYFFDFIVHREWWRNKFIPWWHKYVRISFKENYDGQAAKWIVRLEYFGLLISTMIMHTGKIGEWVYVNNRTKLRYGLFFLYLGGLVRVCLEYGILALILQVIRKF